MFELHLAAFADREADSIKADLSGSSGQSEVGGSPASGQTRAAIARAAGR